MKKEDLRIIFLGNPEFAAFHLQKILDAGFQVVAVVTAPDKEAGRGKQVKSTAVTELARELSIPVLQPPNLKAPAFIEELRSYKADIQVVIAFRMLPEMVWNMPPEGTVNLHASLLPQYRGAAPINWVLINGEQETGVTSFRLKHEIDTGNILIQEAIPIAADESAGTLHDKLMHLGAKVMVDTLEGIVDGTLEEKEQSAYSGELMNAPKIFKEDCEIDWSRSSQEIFNLIRGLSPYPAAFAFIKDLRTKIFRTELVQCDSDQEFVTDGKQYLYRKTADGYLSILELQPEGKKPMTIQEFLRGYGSRFSS